jgi:hypothetical protein
LDIIFNTYTKRMDDITRLLDGFGTRALEGQSFPVSGPRKKDGSIDIQQTDALLTDAEKMKTSLLWIKWKLGGMERGTLVDAHQRFVVMATAIEQMLDHHA